MSLISMTNKLNTANQINAWNNQAIASMQNAKQNYDNLVAQKLSMIDNLEFTQEDIEEVENILTTLNTLASSLTK